MEVYEFLVPGRAVSVHERDRTAYREFQDRVFVEGARVWPGYLPFTESYAHLTIVFLCKEKGQLDVDNAVKPIMDALEPLYYADDKMVSDLDAHRRSWTEDDVQRMQIPDLLKAPWKERRECVYIRIQDAQQLEELV